MAFLAGPGVRSVGSLGHRRRSLSRAPAAPTQRPGGGCQTCRVIVFRRERPRKRRARPTPCRGVHTAQPSHFPFPSRETLQEAIVRRALTTLAVLAVLAWA